MHSDNEKQIQTHLKYLIFASPVFFSPEQRSWKAIVLPPALASAAFTKFTFKFLRPYYFQTL